MPPKPFPRGGGSDCPSRQGSQAPDPAEPLAGTLLGSEPKTPTGRLQASALAKGDLGLRAEPCPSSPRPGACSLRQVSTERPPPRSQAALQECCSLGHTKRHVWFRGWLPAPSLTRELQRAGRPHTEPGAREAGDQQRDPAPAPGRPRCWPAPRTEGALGSSWDAGLGTEEPMPEPEPAGERQEAGDSPPGGQSRGPAAPHSQAPCSCSPPAPPPPSEHLIEEAASW